MESKLQYKSSDFNYAGKKWSDPKDIWMSTVRYI